MTKTILALTVSVLAFGATPALAGGCCGGVPAPVQRMMLNVSGEAAPSAQTEAEAAAIEAAPSEETPAPEAINPASGEAAPATETLTEAPAVEGGAPVEPEAVEDAAQ